jgi:hypothetical protein
MYISDVDEIPKIQRLKVKNTKKSVYIRYGNLYDLKLEHYVFIEIGTKKN